jgi:hypothetical protein
MNSLETAGRMLEEGDDRYAKIETWPDDEVPIGVTEHVP